MRWSGRKLCPVVHFAFTFHAGSHNTRETCDASHTFVFVWKANKALPIRHKQPNQLINLGKYLYTMTCNNAIYNLLSPITEESISTRRSNSNEDAPPRRFTCSLRGNSFVRPEPNFPHLHLDDDDDDFVGYLAPDFDFNEMTDHGSYNHQSNFYREQWRCHDGPVAAVVSPQPLVATAGPYPYANHNEHGGMLQRVDSHGRSSTIMRQSDPFNNNTSVHSRHHVARPPQDCHWVTERDHPSYHSHAFARGPVMEVHIVDDDDCHVPFQYKDYDEHHYYPNPKVYRKEPPPFPERVPSSSRVVYMHDSYSSLFPPGPQRHSSTASFPWDDDDTKPAAVVITPTATALPLQVEVTPGVWLRLRGAVETQRAVQEGFFIATDCPCCTTPLCCIANADFIVCPDCRVVSPIHDDDATDDGGVGLGMKFGDCIS